MSGDKTRRVATAVGFLSGVLASMDALRDGRIFWPPDACWASLRGPQRLELSCGIALIVVTLVISAIRQRDG